MPAPKRSTEQRERDLQVIQHLYFMGLFQSEIEEKRQEITDSDYTLSQGTISNDIKELQKRWRENTAFDIDMMKQKQLQKIDSVEREAWKGWRKSCEAMEKTRQKAKRKNDEVVEREGLTETQERSGDSKFLDIVLDCIAKRSELLGLDAPQKLDVHSRHEFQHPLDIPEDKEDEIESIIAKHRQN